jgi:hypothetical protein
MSISINGTAGLTFNDASTQNTAAKVGMVNRIINGDMRIDQRNAGASVAVGAGTYNIDRFQTVRFGSAATMTQQRVTTAPTGFTNSLMFTVGTAVSPGATDQSQIYQLIEGYNVADLGWGTANAQTITLSFWVRSSVTGTYGIGVRNGGANRAYVASYTVNSANIFEYKTVTIAGDTSGTWATDNTAGLTVFWDLGVGSTYSQSSGSWQANSSIAGLTGGTKLIATAAATFYITGVQLEKGSTATSFDYRDYGRELAMCQRYGLRVEQQQNTGGVSSAAATTNVRFTFPVVMRATPTAALIVAGSWIVGNDFSANYTASSASITAQNLTPAGGRVNIGGFTFSTNAFVAGTDAAGTAVMFMSAEI